MFDSAKLEAAKNAAASFDMSEVLLRYKWKFNVSETEAKEHEQELKRFLVLCALNPKAAYGMLEPVDHLWHEFIIFSRHYVNFCEKVAGKYIHHKSRLPGMSRSYDEVQEMFDRFRSDYRLAFGEDAPSKYWKPTMECSHGNCGGDDMTA